MLCDREAGLSGQRRSREVALARVSPGQRPSRAALIGAFLSFYQRVSIDPFSLSLLLPSAFTLSWDFVSHSVRRCLRQTCRWASGSRTTTAGLPAACLATPSLSTIPSGRRRPRWWRRRSVPQADVSWFPPVAEDLVGVCFRAGFNLTPLTVSLDVLPCPDVA